MRAAKWEQGERRLGLISKQAEDMMPDERDKFCSGLFSLQFTTTMTEDFFHYKVQHDIINQKLQQPCFTWLDFILSFKKD